MWAHIYGIRKIFIETRPKVGRASILPYHYRQLSSIPIEYFIHINIIVLKKNAIGLSTQGQYSHT